MANYIKKCPRCGQANLENADFCENDDFNLARVNPQIGEAKPEGSLFDEFDDVSKGPGEGCKEPRGEYSDHATRAPDAGSRTALEKEHTPVLRLESVNASCVYHIRPGDTLGRGHASSEATVRLDEEPPGIRSVHRNHCRFDYIDGRWQVSPIDQRERGRNFRHSTSVSGRVLRVDESQVLREDDRINLAGAISLRVMSSRESS